MPALNPHIRDAQRGRSRDAIMNEKDIEIISLLCMIEVPLGVRETARMLGLSKSSAHRALQDLEKLGIAKQVSEKGGYVLGPRAYGLAATIQSKFNLLEVAKPVLKELTEKTGETSYLGQYSGGKLILLDKVSTKHLIQYVLPLSTELPLYAGAAGKVILANLPEADADRIITESKLEKITENTVTDPEKLRVQLAQIRKQGFAFTMGERQIGAVGIASVIVNVKGEVFGSIVLTIPETRFAVDKKNVFVQEVKRAAGILSMILGRFPV